MRGWGVSVTPRQHLTPRKDPVPIVQEAGWASGPVWTGAENLAPQGFDPRTFQYVGSRDILTTCSKWCCYLDARCEIIWTDSTHISLPTTSNKITSCSYLISVGLTNICGEVIWANEPCGFFFQVFTVHFKVNLFYWPTNALNCIKFKGYVSILKDN